MKLRLLSVFFLLVCVVSLQSQTAQIVPPGFNFQAQLRDDQGKLMTEKQIELRVSLYAGEFATDADYSEQHTVTTSAFGIVNLVIGTGQTNNDLTKVDFAKAHYWLKVELKTAETFKQAQFAPLQSVPYARVAANVNTMPAGCIAPFAGSKENVPEGWMLCDGSAISRSDYPALFSVLETAWGHGDGITTFNVPDLRGYFIRGADNGKGNDPDAQERLAIAEGGNTGDNVGSVQKDAIRNITGSITNVAQSANKTNTSSGGAITHTDIAIKNDWGNDGCNGVNIDFNAAKVVPTASDNRPLNVYVNYIIKY